VLAIAAGALGEPWTTIPDDFDVICQMLGIPRIEARARLGRATILASTGDKMNSTSRSEGRFG
jgi:hypothetical protein